MTKSEIDRIIVELKSIQVNQTELTKKVNSIYQGLYGIAGTEDNGFCGQFKDLKKDYYEFKRKVIMVLCFVAGAGGLTTAIIKAFD